MARVETQHGVTASLGTTYTSLGQVPAATTWVVVLTVTNRLTSTVKLRAFVADTSWASGEPTGSTLKAAIAYDTIIGPGEVWVSPAAVTMLTTQKLIVYADTGSALDIVASGYSLT